MAMSFMVVTINTIRTIKSCLGLGLGYIKTQLFTSRLLVHVRSQVYDTVIHVVQITFLA